MIVNRRTVSLVETIRNHGPASPAVALVLAACWPILTGDVKAQGTPPAVEWDRTFGEEGKTHEVCAVEQTRDKGFAVLATTAWGTPTKGGAVKILKTDDRGNEVWSLTLGGEGDEARGVFYLARKPLCLTSDRGFVVAAEAAEGNGKIWLFKVNSEGKLVWSRTHATGVTDVPGETTTLQETTDGGFIICGLSPVAMGEGSAAFLLKTDIDGEKIWFRVHGRELPYDPDSLWVSAYSVEQTADGGYVVSGHHLAAGTPYRDLYLLKTDGSGQREWSRGFPGVWEHVGHEEGWWVHQTEEGGYVVLVQDGAVPCPCNTCLVKTDARGEISWTQCHEGDIRQGAPTRDGGYVLTGSARKTDPLGNQVVVGAVRKTDALGKEVWSTTFGPPETGLSGGARQTSDGGYIVAGKCPNNRGEKNVKDIYLAKLAPDSPPRAAFQRGDVNSDLKLNLSDPVCVLLYLFGSAGDPCKTLVPGCLDAADADDDGKAGITDAIYVLLHLFQGGPPLPGPSGECGPDPTPDELGCAIFSACAQ